ncbi:phospholipase, patatin family protein, partial [Aureobasidium melanogenum]
MPGRELNLLSLDGGGVRGLSSLYILQRIMNAIDPDNPPKPCDYFDIIGGTSTGGLIAIMLGRLEMSVDECIKTYTELSKDVFHKTRRIPIGIKGDLKERYDSEALAQAVKKVLRDRGVDEDTLLKNPQGTKVFVCCTSGETSQTALLRTWYTTRGDPDLYKTVRIWEAARATSAASTFFDSITIGDPGQRFLDGGTGANNPIRHLWGEAVDLLSRQESLPNNLGCLISIGTGQPGYKRFEETVQGIGKALLEIATETETTANEFHRYQSQLFESKICFRFNVPRGLGDIGLAETEQISAIKSMTSDYLQTEAVRGDIRICIQQLGERQIRRAGKILRVIDRVSQDEDEDFYALSQDTRWQLADSKNDVLDLLERISEYQPQRVHCKINMQKTPGTTCWIVEEILSWVDASEKGHPDHGRCLWLSGIVGCGKTFLANTAIETLLDRNEQKHLEVPVIHFYFDSNKHSMLTADALFRSYVKQLLRYLYMSERRPSVLISNTLKRMFGKHNYRSDPNQLIEKLLKPLLQHFDSSFLVVDGLDLCSPKEYDIVLRSLSSLLKATSIKVIICGRHELEVARRCPGSSRLEVTQKKVAGDVALFVNQYLDKRTEQRFLWARLQIDVLWQTCSTDAEIHAALTNLPKDLDETYERCLDRVQVFQQKYSLRVLRYVYAAKTPLTIDALGEALAIDLESGQLQKDHIPVHNTILRSGANLIIFDELDRLVTPTHDSVRKFSDSSNTQTLRDLNELILDDAILNLGEMCIAHLLWHVPELNNAENTASAENSNTTRLHLPSVTSMGNWIKPPDGKIASLMSSWIRKDKVITASSKERSQAPLVLNLEASPTPALKLYRPFHRYARKNWTLLTCGFTEKTADWTRFKSFISLDAQVENGRSDAEMFPWRVDGTESPLGWAISEGHLALLELSLTSGQQILSQPLEHYGGLLPLHLASKRGRVEIFKKLCEMKRPTYVDLSPDTGRTSTHYVAEQGHSEIVDYLLSVSTRPNAAGILGDRDREGYSPICLAIISGSITTIEIMVSRCGNIPWSSFRIHDLLDALVAGGSQREMINLVLDKLALREDAEQNPERILSWVLANNNLSLIPYLAKAGVSMNTRMTTRSLDSNWKSGGMPPVIFFALEASTPALAVALIENGARFVKTISFIV